MCYAILDAHTRIALANATATTDLVPKPHLTQMPCFCLHLRRPKPREKMITTQDTLPTLTHIKTSKAPARKHAIPRNQTETPLQLAVR